MNIGSATTMGFLSTSWLNPIGLDQGNRFVQYHESKKTLFKEKFI
jgi:hypothetical protein